PECDVPIETQTSDQVIDKLCGLAQGTKLLVLAPQEVRVGQKYEDLWQRLKGEGFTRVRIDGVTHRLEDVPDMDRRRKHEVDIVVDRVTISRGGRSRVADSIEAALDLGRGTIRVAHVDESRPEAEWLIERYSLHYACGRCGTSYEELTPNNFSFNGPLGWCRACEGLGTEAGTDLSTVVSDPNRSLRDGAVAAWPDLPAGGVLPVIAGALAARFGIPLDVPFSQLDPKHRRIVLYGTGDEWIKVRSQDEAHGFGPVGLKVQYKGVFPAIEEAARVSYAYRQKFFDLRGEGPCSVCGGSRLRIDAAAVRFRGKTLQQLGELPLGEALAFLKSLRLDAADRRVAGDLLNEATSRLSFLVDVGLEYLTLLRPLPTLSGGETQRIRLAGQIGRALTGVLYVLDEPTIGLHPRDNRRLLTALQKLRNLGNTVVLVEHDREVIEASDRLYDFGPGAGRLGGTVTAEGTPKQLARRPASLTGRFLSGKREIPIPLERRMKSLSEDGGWRIEDDHGTGATGGSSASASAASTPEHGWTSHPCHPSSPSSILHPSSSLPHWLELTGCRHNNLRNVHLRIPLGTFTCVTGISGSGKSSLIEDTLARAVARRLHRSTETPAPHDELRGVEHISKVIVVDQQPLGSTPASNPATYTGVFDQIRELFARMPEAKVRGYRPGRFSFNRPGGRCEDCEGHGQKCIEMHFLPDVWVECETCRGRRYNRETLAVTFRGHSVADVLEMPIGQARELFDSVPKIRGCLETLCAIGLDYLTLGQSAPTLSGGEAQRVKLAAELSRPHTGKTLYILDEPTTGLHFDDIDKLLKVLGSLVEAGNTVVVVEHNLDVIKTADWVIDLGPEAGTGGGLIVAEGTPEDVVSIAARYREAAGGNGDTGHALRSWTGELLAPVLAAGTRAPRELFNPRAARKKREGDVEIAELGRQTRMPWQTDGRRWHTRDRVAHNGSPCRWEGAALELVIDWIESAGGFAEPNFNHRSVVEVLAEDKQGGWFLHAMTADEWLLGLKFRVKKHTFDQQNLARKLALTAIDDLDELPVYGRGERVKVKNLKGPWQEIGISVHWLREIDTPAFRTFLAEAREAFFAQAHRAKLNPAELTPWKVLGRKWHLSRKGFLNGKRIRWEPAVLERLLDLLGETWPASRFDYEAKSLVNLRGRNGDGVVATLHTKRRSGIDLTVYVPAQSVALGRIADCGTDRDITPGRDGRDAVRIRIDAPEHLADPGFLQLLAEVSRRA
ncbi:MAG: ATP-binding cassette domain-containing protein, partial [Planctomycetes bacterium]|nr:ATP-binding cassette domain-containing protein [Planctomycetota bacterium]